MLVFVDGADEQRRSPAAERSLLQCKSIEGLPQAREHTDVIKTEPTWQDLDDLISRNGLTDQGVATMRWALTRLRTLLGDSWLVRQYRKQGRLPGELLLAGTHRYALPQALWFILRLDHVAAEPSFAKVKAELRRGADSATWRHTLLQLEVARATEDQGDAVTFEPAIPGSNKNGDLLINGGPDRIWMVETTTIPRAAIDLNWQDYEDQFLAAIRWIEQRHSVACIVVLDDHMAWDETQAWLTAVEAVAASTTGLTGAYGVSSEIGVVTVHREAVPLGTALFTGAAQYRDGWRRLGRTLSAKAVQVRGPWPAWIRVDCLDGLFQFTDWAKMPPQERIAAIAAAIRDNVQWPGNAEGVVLSTGPAVSLGATDPTAEEATVQTSYGAFVRRLLAPHLVRETLVIPLSDDGDGRVRWWTRAYGREPEWLDHDLERAGQLRLTHLWKGRAADAGKTCSGDR
ncbi:MAG: hypothetical protein AUI14_13900 [Actinobacteria bacterium 13_2_20CM_2_71_6]|nr:MAG: hypothetical protein AUI14_13900 [Actinobacteria bacterium 13_2_20CM_2_71_6]